ncbi:response regulator transcription factor [Sphingobacterium sp. HMA12]|uniref:response regulator n=1 Tax=Sphingobacterium sp. HMA12 TaxID=2050894 RepID=UPI000CEA0320|nr:response regulator transcription factor [Sphingobacterium sp. HMA12]
MTTIGIVDDHPLIIEGLVQMLDTFQQFEVVLKAHSGEGLLSALERTVPDVLLLDIELPDTDGTALCLKILEICPELPIIALTNHDEVLYVRKMMRNGAMGYLLKGTDREGLVEAIMSVISGKQFIDREIERSIIDQAITGRNAAVNVKLTSRECEVLALIAHEHSNQEIADRLFLSVRTVEGHRYSLNQKLNIRTAAGLVREAYLRGLI